MRLDSLPFAQRFQNFGDNGQKDHDSQSRQETLDQILQNRVGFRNHRNTGDQFLKRVQVQEGRQDSDRSSPEKNEEKDGGVDDHGSNTELTWRQVEVIPVDISRFRCQGSIARKSFLGVNGLTQDLLLI